MTIKLNLGIHSEPQSESWLRHERYAQRLNELSGGSIKIKIVNSGAVGIEEYNKVLAGQNNMGRIFTLDMPPFPGKICLS